MAESTSTSADKQEQKAPARAAKVSPALTAEGTHTWLKNPADGEAWACPNEVVDHFLGRGYEHTEAPTDGLDSRLYDTPAS